MRINRTLTWMIGSIFLCSPLTGIQWSGDLAVSGAYRSDSLETTLEALDDSDNVLLADTLKGKCINIYQIGLKGRALLCNYFLLRAQADVGRVYNGRYTDVQIDSQNNVNTTQAKICKGHTRDFTIGIGYLFPWWGCVSFGPTAGFSYDDELIEMEHAHQGGVSAPSLDGLRYKMLWQSAWGGVDAVYHVRRFTVNLGYEYHWGDWKAEWLLKGPDIYGSSFSDKRHSHSAYGNILYIDVLYQLLKCWNIGLGFKYQYWKTVNGSVKPLNGTFESVGFDAVNSAPITHVNWRTYGFQILIDRQF